MLSKSFVSLLAVALSVAGTAEALVSPQSILGPELIPDLFRELGLAPTEAKTTYTITLKGANEDALEARMLDIANGGKGEWLSEDELRSYVSPAAEHVDAVKKFLTGAGVDASAISSSRYGDRISVSSTVSQINSMFSTTLNSFTGPLGQTLFRTKQGYTIPAEISEFVLNVSPLTSFADIKRASPITKEVAAPLESRATPSGCSVSSVTPDCLRQLYGTKAYTPTPDNTTDLLVMGYLGQYVSQSDLTTFLTKYRPDAKGYKIPITTAGGAINDPSNPGVESMLDVETTVGATWPLKTTFLSYGTSDPNQNEAFDASFHYVIDNSNDTTRPGVISVSYGDLESSVSRSDANALCRTIQQLAALGTTVVYASGDNGVNGVQPGMSSCTKTFNPTYPGGCPYALSVGGTYNFSPEVAVSTSTSGGFWGGAGFSNYFAQPSYQSAAVANYLKVIGTKDQGKYNASGRAFPDIAAQAQNYAVVISGQTQGVSGTSAAAPTVASVFSLLNNWRKTKGLGRVGWVNPKIYSTSGSAFTDITSGQTKGCGTNTDSFPTSTGWDVVTGWGTPIFSKLQSTFSS